MLAWNDSYLDLIPPLVSWAVRRFPLVRDREELWAVARLGLVEALAVADGSDGIERIIHRHLDAYATAERVHHFEASLDATDDHGLSLYDQLPDVPQLPSIEVERPPDPERERRLAVMRKVLADCQPLTREALTGERPDYELALAYGVTVHAVIARRTRMVEDIRLADRYGREPHISTASRLTHKA